ncbi:MAG: dihydrodipicolinate synthase family protein [Ruminococcaceae bacterium]|nr:dihydrodipicolinate synthase family protein [Oscillospiraceae bacterium]
MIKGIPNGVYPTMVTPFTKDNKVDYNGVLQIIEWYEKNGVDGIFAICQSSEIFFLSFEERLELLRFIMKNKPADMVVVASGHTADELDRQIYEANAFINEGIDAYVFIANRFAKQDEDDSVFIRNYEKMVSSIPEIGLGIYECPYPYKRIMTPETLRHCALDGRLKFLKDTCCRIGKIEAKLKAVEGLGLKIYNANSATLLESLRAGCAGFSGVMANFHPEMYSWLCKNYEKEPEKAEKVQAFLAFASLAECQMYPVNAKYHMGLCGLDVGYDCRVKDASLFTEGNKKEINQMYIVEKMFKEMLGI